MSEHPTGELILAAEGGWAEFLLFLIFVGIPVAARVLGKLAQVFTGGGNNKDADAAARRERRSARRRQVTEAEEDDGMETWRRLLSGEESAEPTPVPEPFEPPAPVAVAEPPAPPPSSVPPSMPTTVPFPEGPSVSSEPFEPSFDAYQQQAMSSQRLGALEGTDAQDGSLAALPGFEPTDLGALKGTGLRARKRKRRHRRGTSLFSGGMRRAIILQEVLGPPVAMRNGHGRPPLDAVL